MIVLNLQSFIRIYIGQISEVRGINTRENKKYQGETLTDLGALIKMLTRRLYHIQ